MSGLISNVGVNQNDHRHQGFCRVLLSFNDDVVQHCIAKEEFSVLSSELESKQPPHASLVSRLRSRYRPFFRSQQGQTVDHCVRALTPEVALVENRDILADSEQV